MPIDDNPIDALKHQFQMEDLAASPVTGRVLQIASSLPHVPLPLKLAIEWLKKHIAADAAERDRLLLETIAAEVVKYGQELEQTKTVVTERASQVSEEVLAALIVDATRRAETTRAKERVQRIGLILANAIIETKPADADEIEEMMRVSTELSDRDVELLRELVRIEGDAVRTQGRIQRYDAYTRWEQGWWATRVIPELDSVFSKLEGYGLVSRIPPPNNLNIMADYQNRYVLLPKGARFVDLIKSRTGAR